MPPKMPPKKQLSALTTVQDTFKERKRAFLVDRGYCIDHDCLQWGANDLSRWVMPASVRRLESKAYITDMRHVGAWF